MCEIPCSMRSSPSLSVTNGELSSKTWEIHCSSDITVMICYGRDYFLPLPRYFHVSTQCNVLRFILLRRLRRWTGQGAWSIRDVRRVWRWHEHDWRPFLRTNFAFLPSKQTWYSNSVNVVNDHCPIQDCTLKQSLITAKVVSTKTCCYCQLLSVCSAVINGWDWICHDTLLRKQLFWVDFDRCPAQPPISSFPIVSLWVYKERYPNGV